MFKCGFPLIVQLGFKMLVKREFCVLLFSVHISKPAIYDGKYYLQSGRKSVYQKLKTVWLQIQERIQALPFDTIAIHLQSALIYLHISTFATALKSAFSKKKGRNNIWNRLMFFTISMFLCFTLHTFLLQKVKKSFASNFPNAYKAFTIKPPPQKKIWMFQGFFV